MTNVTNKDSSSERLEAQKNLGFESEHLSRSGSLNVHVGKKFKGKIPIWNKVAICIDTEYSST